MTDCERNPRRGKGPQQELYSAGGGGSSRNSDYNDANGHSRNAFRSNVNNPLQPSRSQQIEEVVLGMNKVNLSSAKQSDGPEVRAEKQFRKKPGFEHYVPKPVAERRKFQQGPTIQPLLDEAELAELCDRSAGRRKNDGRRKDRGGAQMRSDDDRYPAETKTTAKDSQLYKNKEQDRFVRLGSEPRSLPPYHENRLRDTRSVEPNGNSWRTNAQERLHNKPPAAYHQKKTGFQTNRPAVNLPPRLQNKTEAVKQAEAQANEMLHHQDESFKPQLPPERYNTLPNPQRGRGRGRLRPSDSDQFHRRPLTPDRPHHFKEDKGPSSFSKSAQVFEGEGKENRRQDLPRDDHRSVPNIAELKNFEDNDSPGCSADVLNWAAEVDKEEEETRRMSRSNSKESLQGAGNHSSRNQRKKKKKRSVSRDQDKSDYTRRGSYDNAANRSRNNSVERNWRDRNHASRSHRSSICDNRSRQSSFCDNRSRAESPDHHFVGNRSRKNSSCDNRSRHSSLDRKDWRYRGAYGGGQSDRPVEESKNWRAEMLPPPMEKKDNRAAGIIVLPPAEPLVPPMPPAQSLKHIINTNQRRLYDPSNPEKPIVVANTRSTQEIEQNYLNNCSIGDHSLYMPPSGDLFSSQTPLWYNPYKENFQQSRNPHLIRGIAQADLELQYLLSSGEIVTYWERMQHLRYSLKEALKILLMTDLRFCEAENVEQHLWKILYYNIIELLRKLIAESMEGNEHFKVLLLNIIEDGLDFYEKLLVDVENSNKIKLDHFLNAPTAVREGLGFTGLALIAAQKIYLCLGDLARYKEQVNETCNYGLSRQWYMKAHQINPKNGRPYNQLALLAMYTKRKLDAVYYYMRCLMSSNPMHNAREGLKTLFDDNGKKYEAVDRRKKEERAQKEKEKMKEKEGMSGFRREIWIHPAGGKNVHRTTSTCHQEIDSEEEELNKLTSADLNKIFCTSYLHVHGKLYTKIGMESLTETAVRMLREFRTLLQYSPLPLNSTRFLQLLSLNMFAVEVTQPKADLTQSREGLYRSVAQESALVVSLQMFNLLLERFISLLQEHHANKEKKGIISADCNVILPALKVWCDWMMTHVEVWNPPPSCLDYRVGPAGDCWSRIASLVTYLLKMDFPREIIVEQEAADYEPVYLPEDATLSGFTPLMANAPETVFVHKSHDMEIAQTIHRLKKIEFFGQIFLCGLDPPVLKLHKKEDGESEYISIVDFGGSQPEKTKCESSTGQSENEVFIESMSSSEESDDSGKATGVEEDDGESLQNLIARKGRLERQAKRLQARKNHFQKAIMSEVMTEMEIRPHDLVPDTNCFINYLPQLESLTKLLSHPQHPYVIMVPLVVVNELEGLSKGCKPSANPLHSVMVRETAKAAMSFLETRRAAVRCVTSRGTVLQSAAFTVEQDSGLDMKNDDKILTTVVNLTKSHKKDEFKEGGRRKLYRDVVLLTEDRSLKLKAISKDMPVRSLPDFMKWAGLG